ncbi:protein of unknown function (DUF4455) [Popillia japonica]|uniref:DUF4455 domain-containing protein n=1 Tax=Popillia japonica TaxID=7064 RepID=A0AAW1HV90_POPJA
MKKRQKEHEAILAAMKNAMTNHNIQVEDDIRVASAIYKQEFKKSKTEIKICLQNIREIIKGPAKLATENFNKAVDDVSLIYRVNKFHLTTLLQKLRELERSRISKFKELLRTAYSKLNKISYKLPFEIQQFFEQEIQAINETTLCNIRGYNELKLHLRLQLKNEIRLCFEEIQYLKEKWYYYVKYTLFTNLNRDKLFSKDWNREALRTSVPVSDACSPYTDWAADGATIDVNKMFQWVSKIEHVMKHVDTCAQKIVGSFKDAIIKVVAGYFEDMRKTVQSILDEGIIEKWEVKAIQAEYCGQAVVDVTEKYTEQLARLQDLWTESKRELELCLDDALLFLKHFSDIWSIHFYRVNQIKDLISQDLKRVMTEGFLLVCEDETKINIKIDSLRQECNEQNLDQELDNVSKCLDDLKQV